MALPEWVDVTVRRGSVSGTLPHGFLYDQSSTPTITDITPSAGPTAGGTAVAIDGAGFAAGATVTFGGVAATSVVIVNAGRITCVTPAHAEGAVDVVVTVGNLSATAAGAFTYSDAAVTLTSIDPTTGPVGGNTLVTLTGTGFASNATVTFDGTQATSITVVNATTITCRTPAHAAGAVDVTVALGAATATLTDGFTYTASTLTADSLTPTSGPTVGGTVVTVTGSGFTTSGIIHVSFGGAEAGSVTVVNDTTLTCVTTAHVQGQVDVVVTAQGGTDTITNGFRYTDETPGEITIYEVIPDHGPTTGNTNVTLIGTGFVQGMVVLFGDVPATNVTVESTTRARCYTPPHAVGAVNVTAYI